MLVAFGTHAPDGLIRIGIYVQDSYNVLECGRGGAIGVPADLTAIQEAITKTGFASWANDDAPPMLGTLLLPGAGWELDALYAEPAVVALMDRDPMITELQDTALASGLVDARGARILEVATRHRLLAVFR